VVQNAFKQYMKRRNGGSAATAAGLWHSRRGEGGHAQAGFTLVELFIVISIMLILISVAVPVYHTSVVRAKEAVLRDNLFTMRQQIDNYTMDKKAAPQSLQDLVPDYLRDVPTDPFTRSNTTWQVVMEDALSAVDQIQPGIVDVKSGSDRISLEGTPYNTW
jgi:general secretion pathway protein G